LLDETWVAFGQRGAGATGLATPLIRTVFRPCDAARQTTRRLSTTQMGELVDRDQEQLQLLSLFHYITAGVTAVFGSFPLIHVLIGVVFLFLPETLPSSPSGKGGGPPREVGFMFIGLGGLFVAAGWTLAALHFLTGRYLKQRRNYWFCLVVSGVSSLICMFGNAVVGIATIVVLSRHSVRDLFQQTVNPVGTGGDGGEAG
jgi:hypothetical protein